MAIKIQNLRITPYSAKDTLKVVFGDEMELTFTIPHVEGESFLCGLDNDRVVYPPSRPICAYTNTYTRDGDDVTFRLKLTTSRLRDYVSHIRKPMPVWLQVVRVVNGRYETVLLDDILALPSVIDGAMTVCEGDPLGELLDGKMDKPATEGTEGQVLTMGADGHYAWADLPEIPEKEQADWDESDSTAVSYIQNKPRIIPFPTMEPGQPLRVGMVLTSKQGGTTWADATDRRFTSGMETVNLTMEDGSTVQTSLSLSKKRSGGINQFGNGGDQNYVVGTDLFLNGSTKVSMTTPSFEYNGNQLNTAGGLVEVGSDGKVPDGLLVNADWDESDSTEASFIQNKPDVYTKGETDALLDGKAGKATTLAGYGITDAYTKTEVDQKVASVYRYKGTVATYADLPSTDLTVGDVYNVETADSGHGIKAGDNVAWNGTTWDVLAGEIVFPEQVQANWDESDSSEKSFIQNKPIIPAPQVQSDWDESDSSDVSFILNKPVIPEQVQSDWDESDSTSPSYIQNKPSISGGGDVPDSTDYLCFTAAQANSSVRMDGAQGSGANPDTVNLEYSTDKKTWTAYTWTGLTGATIALASIGDRVWFRGDNDHFGRDVYNGDYSYYKFVMNGKIYGSGNLMSLLDKHCGQVQPSSDGCFYNMFSGCASLITAPKMDSTIVGKKCYYGMFSGCTSLVVAPELPATTLGDSCYQYMFSRCTKLVTAPKLPATALIVTCYNNMFYGCTSLVIAPELPATTATWGCYGMMFEGCTNLVEAPVINLTAKQTGANNELYHMFYGASKINRIKVMHQQWLSSEDWLTNTVASGVFECPSALDTSTRDASHVPAGWTIVRSDSPKSITSPTTSSSAATYEVSPNTASVPVVTVSSALTLSATAIDSGSVAYAEVVLDIDANATVTAGTNLTLVDTPEAGKRNVCVVRWSGGVAKLYVTIVEDLPQA